MRRGRTVGVAEMTETPEGVEAFRLWIASETAHGYRLTSPLFAGFVWPTDRMTVAACHWEHPELNAAPELGCACGIAAFERAEQCVTFRGVAARPARVRTAHTQIPAIECAGRVRLFGRVLYKPDEYGGQFCGNRAQVEEIHLPADMLDSFDDERRERILSDLGAYGVPVIVDTGALRPDTVPA
jgi:hypothetical protein